MLVNNIVASGLWLCATCDCYVVMQILCYGSIDDLPVFNNLTFLMFGGCIRSCYYMWPAVLLLLCQAPKVQTLVFELTFLGSHIFLLVLCTKMIIAVLSLRYTGLLFQMWIGFPDNLLLFNVCSTNRQNNLMGIFHLNLRSSWTTIKGLKW